MSATLFEVKVNIKSLSFFFFRERANLWPAENREVRGGIERERKSLADSTPRMEPNLGLDP